MAFSIVDRGTASEHCGLLRFIHAQPWQIWPVGPALPYPDVISRYHEPHSWHRWLGHLVWCYTSCVIVTPMAPFVGTISVIHAPVS